ncbi:MAG: hypothetical protein ACK4VI_00705 [Alphaproteobacteria bacterium]
MAISPKSALTRVLHCSLLALILLPAKAEATEHKAKRLNDANIRAFVTELTQMTSGNNLNTSAASISKFLDIHLHPRARFVSNLEYVIPGHPKQSKAMSLDKSQFIENVQAGSQALDSYENKVEIKSIKISRDRRNATIETRGKEKGVMNVSADGLSNERVPVDGYSDCTQIIMLDSKDILQIYNANCKTVINFKDY